MIFSHLRVAILGVFSYFCSDQLGAFLGSDGELGGAGRAPSQGQRQGGCQHKVAHYDGAVVLLQGLHHRHTWRTTSTDLF